MRYRCYRLPGVRYRYFVENDPPLITGVCVRCRGGRMRKNKGKKKQKKGNDSEGEGGGGERGNQGGGEGIR